MSVWRGTKGPWRIVEQGDADDFAMLTADGKWVVAFRHNGEALVDLQRINVRGMAATPRLVDALAALLQETIDQCGIGTAAMFEAHAALKDAGVEL